MTVLSFHSQVNTEPLRRYYLHNKKNKKKRRMDSDEVATDYKLKQFLNDVQKFSGRSKLKQEKYPSSHKSEVKKGIFENGMISRPSMKGILGSKNKARLFGNLQNLLNEEVNSVSNPNGESSSKEQDDPEERSDSSEEKEVSRDTKKLISWGNKFIEKPEDNVKTSIRGESSKSDKVEDLTKGIFMKDLDDLIKYTEKRDHDIMLELKNTLPNVPAKTKEEFLFECQKNIVSALQKNFLEKALKDKESLVDNLKLILEEYIKSKKPQMVDKSQQTLFPIQNWEKLHNPKEDMSEKHFFGSKALVEEKPFGFHPIKKTNPEILTPLVMGSINPLVGYKKSERVIETPQEFRNSEPPIVQRKNQLYVPAILSPPSPGRNYSFNWLPSMKPLSPLHQIPTLKSCINRHEDTVVEAPSPSFLAPFTTEKSQKHSSRFLLSSNKKLNFPPCLRKVPKENQLNFIDLNKPSSSFDRFEESNESLKESSSFLKSFQFPKRAKLQFSPHRL